ncbi:MAG: lamin tail domain-containing protein, partial [Rubrobacter sp.]|nr:lamin tail domain-containing protein [Rubrobacter sp.]
MGYSGYKSRREQRKNRVFLAFVFALAALGALAVLFAERAAASENGVVISEIQPRGPEGGNDEFVELTNASGEAVNISGYSLEGCAASSGNPSNRATVPEGISLAPDESFLLTNDNASGGYSGDVAGDESYGVGISDTGGARIVDASGAAVDGVASADGEDECREGEGLDFPTTNSSENAFERADDGTRDTDDNASDFQGPQTADPESLSGKENSGGDGSGE